MSCWCNAAQAHCPEGVAARSELHCVGDIQGCGVCGRLASHKGGGADSGVGTGCHVGPARCRAAQMKGSV
jgi:hypothetical protein